MKKSVYTRDPVLFEPIGNFFTPRSLNALRKIGYDFVFIGEFLLLHEKLVDSIPGIGRKAWQDIRSRIYEKGLCIAVLSGDPDNTYRKAFLRDVTKERARLGR